MPRSSTRAWADGSYFLLRPSRLPKTAPVVALPSICEGVASFSLEVQHCGLNSRFGLPTTVREAVGKTSHKSTPQLAKRILAKLAIEQERAEAGAEVGGRGERKTAILSSPYPYAEGALLFSPPVTPKAPRFLAGVPRPCAPLGIRRRGREVVNRGGLRGRGGSGGHPPCVQKLLANKRADVARPVRIQEPIDILALADCSGLPVDTPVGRRARAGQLTPFSRHCRVRGQVVGRFRPFRRSFLLAFADDLYDSQEGPMGGGALSGLGQESHSPSAQNIADR